LYGRYFPDRRGAHWWVRLFALAFAGFFCMTLAMLLLVAMIPFMVSLGLFDMSL
jgi:hypothetical protein